MRKNFKKNKKQFYEPASTAATTSWRASSGSFWALHCAGTLSTGCCGTSAATASPRAGEKNWCSDLQCGLLLPLLPEQVLGVLTTLTWLAVRLGGVSFLAFSTALGSAIAAPLPGLSQMATVYIYNYTHTSHYIQYITYITSHTIHNYIHTFQNIETN